MQLKPKVTREERDRLPRFLIEYYRPDGDWFVLETDGEQLNASKNGGMA